jgi:LysM domain-containing protein
MGRSNRLTSSRFSANAYSLASSCSQFGVPNNSDDEIRQLYNAIRQISDGTNVDARFILGIVLQESFGCVRAPTTNYGVRNPGLMQSHNGVGTCNDKGTVQNPCPAHTILQMVQEGVVGTPSGDGLYQLIGKSGGVEDIRYFEAARMYNSGSIDSSGNLGAGIATHCYCSDVANRLTGWVNARKTCSLDGITEGSNRPASLAFNYDPAYPFPLAIQNKAVSASNMAAVSEMQNSFDTESPIPSPSISVISSPGFPIFSSASTAVAYSLDIISTCTQFYTVQAGDYCMKIAQSFGISFQQFLSWNTDINSGCTNLQAGRSYCVKA